MSKILTLSALFFMGQLSMVNQSDAIEVMTDIQYASVAGHDLTLDLYLPENVNKPNLIIWIHGGAWRFGSKEDIPVISIVNEGFALASINFRNSPDGQFPAQMHDINASVRFLRAKAADYGYSPEKIAVWGYSSGGHLAALKGTTNGNATFEGSVGGYLEVSSDVQAIIDFSGPTNFQTILHQSTPHGVSVRAPALEQLLGKPIEDPTISELVIQASPVHQVSALATPLLIMHGVQDNQVPINQSLELQDAYLEQGLTVQVEWVVEAQHTSGEYFESPYIEQVAKFLREVL